MVLVGAGLIALVVAPPLSSLALLLAALARATAAWQARQPGSSGS
jgi:hypothetical protein